MAGTTGTRKAASEVSPRQLRELAEAPVSKRRSLLATLRAKHGKQPIFDRLGGLLDNEAALKQFVLEQTKPARQGPAPVAPKDNLAGIAVRSAGAQATVRSEESRRASLADDLFTGKPVATVAQGEVMAVNSEAGTFTLRLRTGREVEVRVDENTWYDVLTNLDGASRNRLPQPQGNTPADRMRAVVTPGQRLSLKGVLYVEAGHFDAKAVTLPGSKPGEYEFERAGWYSEQLRVMGQNWLDTYFAKGERITKESFAAKYRTNLDALGRATADITQETATLARLLYGLSTTYLATGEPRFLEAAKAGVEFQREAFRKILDDGSVLWSFGRRGNKELVASEGSDDVGTIPLYEQIYALAGITAYYRATHDAQALNDIQLTLRSFEKYFRDPVHGGYYSHIDPLTLRADAESLGDNRARKNWNSVGDHGPAYLINLIAALGPKSDRPDERELNALRDVAENILKETSELIVRKFPDGGSPFVVERFDAQWNPDLTYRWQQNRGVAGHDFKIAWNLTRMAFHFEEQAQRNQTAGHSEVAADYSRRAREALDLARKLAKDMSDIGLDQVGGGVLDARERVSKDGVHRLPWGPSKDFWQQEQAILALLIVHQVAGVRPGEESQFLRDARATEMFWNQNFLSRSDGRVYFRVNENGQPVADDPFFGAAGNHSKSYYHASENAFLARLYHSYHTKEPFTIHMQLDANRRQEVIPVSPDFMPPGAVEIAAVRVNGRDIAVKSPKDLQVVLAKEDRGKPVSLTVTFKPVGEPLAVGAPLARPAVKVTAPRPEGVAKPVFDAVFAGGTVQPEAHRGKPLAGKKIVVLVESEFIPQEMSAYKQRFEKYGAEVVFASNLWEQKSLTFQSTLNRPMVKRTQKMEVNTDVRDIDLNQVAAVVVAANYTTPRLRWTPELMKPGADAAQAVRKAPAVDFLRRAMENPNIVVGAACHGLWLATPLPEMLAGRKVTFNAAVASDILNTKAQYVPPPEGSEWAKQVVVDDSGRLVTSASFEGTGQLVDAVTNQVLWVSGRNHGGKP